MALGVRHLTSGVVHPRIGVGRLAGILHLVLVQIVTYQLTDHLRGGHVLLQTEFFQGFFLVWVDGDGQTRRFRFEGCGSRG